MAEMLNKEQAAREQRLEKASPPPEGTGKQALASPANTPSVSQAPKFVKQETSQGEAPSKSESDVERLHVFFEALYHQISPAQRDNLLLEIAFLPGVGEAAGGGMPAKAFKLDDLKRAAEKAHVANLTGLNVYYGLNPRKTSWREKGSHAATEDVAVVVGLCVDDPEGQRDVLIKAMPPPSFIVETSPGKFQAIWLLREPIYRDSPNWERAERLQTALRRHFNAEAGDITRVLRCPSTTNHKYPTKPITQVVAAGHWDGRDPERVYRYTLEELERMIVGISPIPAASPVTSTPALVSRKELPLGGKFCLRRAFKEGVERGRRNNAGIILASEARKWELPPEKALAALRDWNRRNRPPLPDRELEALVKSAYNKPEPYDYGCNEYREVLGMDEATCEKECEWLRKAKEAAKTKRKKEFETTIYRTFDHHEEVGAFVTIAQRLRGFFIDQNGEARESIRTGDLMVKPPFGPEARKGLILYPTEVEDFTSLESLYNELIEFYRQYYEAAKDEDYSFMALYALASWFTPRLPATPILNFEGPSSKGKSRGSEVVWLTSAYPYRTSGTKFASWIRTTDHYHPVTILINEADFDRQNPESEELVKFYNIRPVREEAVFQRMLDNKQVQSYFVFGPTITTTRQPFDDDAIERRAFKIRPKTLTREDIPFNLDEKALAKAQELRNKLAGMALEYLPKYQHHYLTLADIKGRRIEPRLAQLCEGLINVASMLGLREAALKALEAATLQQKEAIALTRDALIIRGYFHVLRGDPDRAAVGVTPGEIAAGIDELTGVAVNSRTIGRRLPVLGFVRDSRRYRLPPHLHRERALDYLPQDEWEDEQTQSVLSERDRVGR